MKRLLLCATTRIGAALLAFVSFSQSQTTPALNRFQSQSITTLDVPGATYTFPQANNVFGQITGSYQDASFGVHGFLRQTNGNVVTFDPSGSLETEATGINDLGQITGYYRDADGTNHGFLRQRNGSFSTFDAPNSPFPPDPDLCEWRTDQTFAQGINLVGQIVGYHRQRLTGLIPGVACGSFRFQGFLRNRDGSLVSFGIALEPGVDAHFVGPKDINIPGKIVGSYRRSDIGGPMVGFLRQPDGTIKILEGTTFATAINLFGQITGYYSGADSLIHGFLRQPNGTIVTFDPDGSTGTQATAINDLGQITGNYSTADSTYHGYVREWNGDITTFDLPNAGTANGAGTFPRDINLFGQLTGYYQDSNMVIHGFIGKPPVP
jgi:probable HAF family extracellular repeat protein